MCKTYLAAIVWLDEPEAFVLHELLDCARQCHGSAVERGVLAVVFVLWAMRQLEPVDLDHLNFGSDGWVTAQLMQQHVCESQCCVWDGWVATRLMQQHILNWIVIASYHVHIWRIYTYIHVYTSSLVTSNLVECIDHWATKPYINIYRSSYTVHNKLNGLSCIDSMLREPLLVKTMGVEPESINKIGKSNETIDC